MNRTDVLLLDAGVWIGARDPDDRFHADARRLVLGDLPVAALDLTPYEIANAVGARKRQVEEARYLLRLLRLRCAGQLVSVDDELLGAAIDLSAEHGLTAYDAAYVAVARRHGWTLVSTDLADLVSKGLAVTPGAADYPLTG